MTLQVRDVAAERGGFRLAIDEWQVAAGEVMAVLGTNGAGKSSLFGVLSGDIAHEGELRFHDRDLRDWPALARARHIGVLLQQTQLAFAFTAAEVVALGLTPLSVGWRHGARRVRDMLARTDCAHLAERAYPSLSGGERQRVNLARVLLQLSEAEAAPLLLLDEPTSAQDLGHQHGLLRLTRTLAVDAGWAVVSILHDLNLALRYADQCLVLADGQVKAQGTPKEVLEPSLIEHHWGYKPERVFSDTGEPALV